MCFSAEYAIFPVRHNEDKTNQELASMLNYKTSIPMDSPHLKVILLIYSYLSNLDPPTREYMVDTKSVLDQALRILQGMLDIASNSGWLSVSLRIIHFLQMILQGHWLSESCLVMLPHVEKEDVITLHNALNKHYRNIVFTLANLKKLYTDNTGKLKEIFAGVVGVTATKDIDQFLSGLPIISMNLTAEDESTNSQQIIDFIDGKMYSFTADSSVDFKFQLNRRGVNSLDVHSNRFTKQKDESWILVIGLPEEDVLLASRKLSFRKQKTVSVKLKMPTKKGLTSLFKSDIVYVFFLLAGDYMLCIYLMSDSYIGLDQQYLINTTVI